ncbi:hypothetical protein [Methylobacter sp.]|uniref:hypothetical protein n=1 Tax=Methylobacter sp. TaxID=2051955 RepID=UPI00248A7C9B|nr:hypothetical protein [Methylobacter sp.]MDI1278532.1 hypothetical protein [Methylobacter sp.]MDI1359309.1 hypothetical protein [Methylobacter sp.]
MSENDTGWPYIRRAESVAFYPTENIVSWSVREAIFYNGDMSRHLIGFIPGKSGRVTSAIQTFCPENRTITTQSGRVYTLKGMPGSSDDGQYVWKYWSAGNFVIHDIDVTDEYTRQIKNLVM